MPLPRWQAAPATTTALDSQLNYAPGSGLIHELTIGLDSKASKGKTLFVVESEDLNSQAELARLEMECITIELTVIKSDEQQRAVLPRKREELTRATAGLEGILAALVSNQFVAYYVRDIGTCE